MANTLEDVYKQRLVDADGQPLGTDENPLVTSGGGSSGSSDATAANQALQITAANSTNTKLDTIDGHVDGVESLLTAIDGHVDGLEASIGATNDSAASSDTGTFSVIAFVKRLMQKLTTQLPAALGGTTAANSLPVTLATDGQFVTSIGSVTESAPGTDTASSGINGRLQRIAQRLTSLLTGTPILPVNLAFSSSGAALNADIVASFDCSNYRSGSVQVGGFGSATVSVQFSNDGGTTWVTIKARNINTGAIALAISAAGLFTFEIPAALLCRIRITTYSSGTITGAGEFSTLPYAPFDSAANMRSANTDIANASAVGTVADGATANASGMGVIATLELWNGANYDKFRAVTANSVLVSAARTATVSTDVTNFNGRSFAVILNITAAPNTASTLTLQIRAKDSISGNYYTILASVAILGSTSQSPPYTNRYIVSPGITIAANVTSNDALARTMNVNVVHSNSDSWTYSVSVDIGV